MQRWQKARRSGCSQWWITQTSFKSLPTDCHCLLQWVETNGFMEKKIQTSWNATAWFPKWLTVMEQDGMCGNSDTGQTGRHIKSTEPVAGLNYPGAEVVFGPRVPTKHHTYGEKRSRMSVRCKGLCSTLWLLLALVAATAVESSFTEIWQSPETEKCRDVWQRTGSHVQGFCTLRRTEWTLFRGAHDEGVKGRRSEQTTKADLKAEIPK